MTKLYFKWVKKSSKLIEKNANYTGTIEVGYGYAGGRKIIGFITRTKSRITGTLHTDGWVSDTFVGKNATSVKMALTKEYDHYMNEMVTVTALMSGKEVRLRRSEVGGVCDPSTERYYTM